jgi:hypothetical protein
MVTILESSAADSSLRYLITGIPDCCARATGGHAAARD